MLRRSPTLTETDYATGADSSGIAAGTAFDFLGDGKAEAMYADETSMFVFNEHGQAILTMPRTSGTLTEYPVVADIETMAQQSAWSSQFVSGRPVSPTVQVIRSRYAHITFAGCG